MVHDPHSGNRTLDPGTVVRGRYVVEEKIAEGGMASIHRTLDRKTGRHVVLKALYPFYCEQPVVCTRFLDEGRIQRYLEHPNIIDVFEIVEASPLAIIMEYIPGPTLEEYLSERGPLNILELLNLMLPVLSAVGFAHQKGVIHRDLKPSNILLEETPTALIPKVMDFGVAKVSRGQDLTADGTTVGTLHYMSPEQIVGSKAIDGRADIYSLGVTLYKLCTGEVPFNAATEFALMMAQVEAEPTPPRLLRPEVPERLEAIILRTLAKIPEGRFQNIGELTAALLQLKEEVEAKEEPEATLTFRFSDELLRHAMMANEVAVDRTSELDMLESAEFANLAIRTSGDGAGSEDETTERAGASRSVEPTMQLDRERLKARMRADRAEREKKLRSMDGEELRRIQALMLDSKDTRPIERETTREQDGLDSRAFTRPFERPWAQEPTVKAPRPTVPHPAIVEEDTDDDTVDEPSARISDSFYEVQMPDEISVDRPMRTRIPQQTTPPQKYGLEDAVDGFKSPEFAELRARASGAHSLTDISRDEILEDYGRSLRPQEPVEAPEEAPSEKERPQPARSRRMIAAILAALLGLALVILWYLFGR